jgi:type IV secretory pathway TraG/TraD family ATPase VirD4
MSRADIAEPDRRDFFAYVDEFQNFVTDSFATILSEARKYRLSLTLATQYLKQMERDGNTVTRDAVFGNVGSIISFQVTVLSVGYRSVTVQLPFRPVSWSRL